MAVQMDQFGQKYAYFPRVFARVINWFRNEAHVCDLDFRHSATYQRFWSVHTVHQERQLKFYLWEVNTGPQK